MITVVQDTEAVPETGSISGKTLMFTMTQQGPVSGTLFLRNAGANQIDYILQEFNGTSWVDLGAVGTDFNDSLPSGVSGTNLFVVSSSYARVRMIASSVGSSTLEFAVTRFVTRAASGDVPILNL